MALNVIRRGVTAEECIQDMQVYRRKRLDYPFRCGRALVLAFLEKPQLVSGDKTILKTGMVLAVDGSIQ